MTTYASAGVDISAGNTFASMIRDRVKKAWPESAKEIGGFAGGGAIPQGAEIFEASTDGTGTVALIAAITDRFDSIGFNAVAMGAVDAYVAGVRPSHLLDTLGFGQLIPKKHIKIIDSIIEACKKAGCMLIGGETAELPDMFRYPWIFNVDVAVIGFPDPDLKFVPVRPGQKVYGWLSFGAGSNGYSLLRKIHKLKIEEDFWFHIRQALRMKNKSLEKVKERLAIPHPELGNETLADALLVPTPIWIQQIEEQRKRGVQFAGHAHITGGGLIENIPRILPMNYKVIIRRNSWVRPAIFRYTQDLGNVPQSEMDRVFNQGIMVVSIVDPEGPMPDNPNIKEIGVVEERGFGYKGCYPEAQVEFTGKHKDEFR